VRPTPDDSSRRRADRAAARARWPVRRFPLGEEPPDDLSEVTTPAERIAMMWPLAVAAWTLARRPWPAYDRRTMPARLLRAGAPLLDDDDA
jgi:hypothetical protein